MRGNLALLHPKYLDNKGLVWIWREGIYYYRAFASPFSKYRKFRYRYGVKCIRESCAPRVAIANYLYYIWKEAIGRGLKFNKQLMNRSKPDLSVNLRLEVDGETVAVCAYETTVNLIGRGKEDATIRYNYLKNEPLLQVHPLFRVIKNEDYLENWWKKYEERTTRSVTVSGTYSINGTYPDGAVYAVDTEPQTNSAVRYYTTSDPTGSPYINIEGTAGMRENDVGQRFTISSSTAGSSSI